MLTHEQIARFDNRVNICVDLCHQAFLSFDPYTVGRFDHAGSPIRSTDNVETKSLLPN
jgi:hypothetical protein